jgi:hypothetical protein
MLLKRVSALIALAAGLLGILACVAGFYLVWLVGARLDQANEKVFATLDRGLGSAQERVRGVQQRVKESKTRTTELVQNLRDWGADKTKERLVSAVEIEKRGEQLTGYLQTADEWLETSTEKLRGVQQVLQLGGLVGARTERISLDQVLVELASMRAKLQEMEQSMSAVRDFRTNKEGESNENRAARVIKFLASTELAQGAIDTRLGNSLAHLTQIQADVLQSKPRISNYILRATLAGYLVLTWIAAGQVALGGCGWKNLVRS